MNCSFEGSAPTEETRIKKIAAHAASVHNIKTAPPDLAAKIKKAIKVEPKT
jgi:predicted small metal-binding protein